MTHARAIPTHALHIEGAHDDDLAFFAAAHEHHPGPEAEGDEWTPELLGPGGDGDDEADLGLGDLGVGLGLSPALGGLPGLGGVGSRSPGTGSDAAAYGLPDLSTFGLDLSPGRAPPATTAPLGSSTWGGLGGSGPGAATGFEWDLAPCLLNMSATTRGLLEARAGRGALN